MKSLWPASANRRRHSEALISSEPLRPSMDTQDIREVALRLASQSEIPADTTINVPARNVRRALIGIDVEAADLLMAKEKGYDAVIAHHPTGGSATLDFPKVLVKHADILTRHGVPRAVADAAVREMQEEREPRARAAFEHGIDTVFYIHIDAGALRRLWELFGREGSKNLVVTGHVASDSIGINALVRELRKRGLRVDTYSGIVDV